MSVTILKSTTTWQAVRSQDASDDRRTRLRGRVITGLLTADEPGRPDVTAREPRDACSPRERVSSGEPREAAEPG